MKRISRKQLRFIAFLLLMWSWHVMPVNAQNFEPLTPTETLIGEIADGTASLSQFEDLAALEAQQQLTDDITALLARPGTEDYFDNNFNPDGAHGERKDGRVVDDWETLAKGMGTSGAVLAGAYAVWRSRRRDELTALRAGDEAAIEDLFDQNFGHLSGVNLETVIPKTGEQWEEWALSRGLPGAGVLVSTLFLVWKRRQEAGSENLDIYESNYTTPNMSWSLFYRAVYTQAAAEMNVNTEAAMAAQGLIKPVVPPKSRAVTAIETRNVSFNTIGNILRSHQTNLIRSISRVNYDSVDRVKSYLENGLYSTMLAYVSDGRLQEAGTRPRYYFENVQAMKPLNTLKSYFNAAKAKLSAEEIADYETKIAELEASLPQIYDNAKAEKAQYDTDFTQYQADNLVYNTAYNLARTQARNNYNDVVRGAYAYWQNGYQLQQDKLTWAQRMTEWATTVQLNFTTHQAQQKADLADQIQNLATKFTTTEIAAITGGTYQFAQDESFILSVAEKATELELEKTGLNALADNEYRRQYDWAMSANQNIPDVLRVWPNEQKVRADYVAKHLARIDQELVDYKAAKADYDLRRLFAAGTIDLATDLADLFPPVEPPASQGATVVASRLNELKGLLGQTTTTATERKTEIIGDINETDMAAYHAGLEAARDQELSQALTVFNAGFNAINPRYVGSSHNYHNGNWFRYAHRHSQQVRDRVTAIQNTWNAQKRAIYEKYQVFNDLSQQKLVQEQAAAQAEKVRQASIAEYAYFRNRAHLANQTHQFLQRLNAAADKSQFFASQQQDLGALSDYENKIAELKAKMAAEESPFYAEEKALLDVQAVPNKYTPAEILQKFHPTVYQKYLRGEVNWTTIEGLAHDASLIGQGNGYAEQQLGNYLYGITSNHGGYSEEKIRVLTGLVDKAFAAKMNAYTGWEHYYREHPLVREAKDLVRIERIQELRESEANRVALLEQQIADLERNQQETLNTLAASQEFLVQTAEERANSDFLQTVVDQEVALSTNSGDASGAARLAALAAVQAENEEELITVQAEVLEITKPSTHVSLAEASQRYYDKFYGGTLGRVVDQMRYNSSEEGRQRISDMLDRQGTTKHNTPHYAGGSYAASQGRAPAREYVTIKDEHGNWVDVKVPPVTVAPNLPFIAAKYGKKSQEYADSIKQYNNFRAAQALPNPADQFDYLPTDPSQVELVETLEEALEREAAERAHAQQVADLAAEADRIQAENAQIAAEKLANLEQATQAVSDDLVTDVEGESRRVVGLGNSQTATEVRIDPNYNGPAILEGNTLVISTNETGLIEALTQRNLAALRVGAEGLVIGGVELTILAAEGLSKLVKIAGAPLGGNGIAYALMDSLDKSADKAQSEIDWYVKNAVYSEHLSELENSTAFIAGGLLTVNGVAKTVVAKSGALISAIKGFGDDLVNGGDEIIRALNQQPEYATLGPDLNNASDGGGWTEKLGNWFSDTWGDIKQQFSGNGAGGVSQVVQADLDNLFRLARQAKSNFGETLNGLARNISGAEVDGPKIKGRERALEKINTKYGGDIGSLQDVLRGTVTFDNYADLQQGFKRIEDQFPGSNIVDLKDQFNPPKFNGYRDMNIKVRTENGTVAEIQLHLKEMYKAKQLEQPIYNSIRSKVIDLKTATGAQKEILTTEIKALRAESKAIYENAWNLSQ